MKRNFSHKFIMISFFSLIAIICVLSLPQVVDARAGGGHNYSGGGGGGGGGGASIIGDLIFFLIRLSFYHPFIGIPLLLIVIYIFFIASHEGSERYVDYTIKRAAPVQDKYKYKNVLAKIKQRDPGFNEDDFVTRAKVAFTKIQDAWSIRDITKGEAFISDGIYERFSLQIGDLKSTGVIDYMENMNILEALPVELESDKNFDTIHIRFKVRAINYRKDEKTNKLIDGSKSPEVFSEVWSFIRRYGAKTSKKPGLIEGQCPNCGNPLKIGRISQCEVCQSFLRSGEYDWVLTEITQACEWKINDIPAPGLQEMVKQDPAFNIQHIEDKTSVIFWRKLEAEKRSDSAFLKKVATDKCTSELLDPGKIKDEQNRTITFTDCAIGSVEVSGVQIDEPFDKVYVTVVWSGYSAYIASNNKIVKTSNIAINKSSIYILKRKHGIKTKLNNSLSSSHCPACGAPEKTGMENTCEYCNTVLNDGSVDWVLDEISDRYARNVSEFFESTKKSTNRAYVSQKHTSIADIYILKWAIAMMFIDGVIDPKEEELILKMAKKSAIPTNKITEIMTEFKSVKDPVNLLLETGSEKITRTLLEKIARVALADGRLAKEEIELLNKVGEKIGFTPPDVNMLVKQERALMYKEAKAALRDARKNK